MGLENLFTLISRAPYFCPSVLQFIVAPRNPRNRRETCETVAKSGEITAKPLAKSRTVSPCEAIAKSCEASTNSTESSEGCEIDLPHVGLSGRGALVAGPGRP